MDRVLLVYTTFPDRETAQACAEALIRERLAACVNMIPGMASVYAWKGSIERGEEVVALVKTRAGLGPLVHAAIKARHPYETPILIDIAPDAADPATLAWILGETSRPDPA
jgi:periplasmic divalent cation tolerance protein